MSTIQSKASSCKKLKNIIKSKSDNQLSTFVLTHSALKLLGIMGSLNIKLNFSFQFLSFTLFAHNGLFTNKTMKLRDED